MTSYALNLDCTYVTTDGNLQPYNYNNGNPAGQVWAYQPAGGSWGPLPCNNPPDNDGNPAEVSPSLANGDNFWVAIRDTTMPTGWSITNVNITIVFSRFTRGNQAPIASPFQNSGPDNLVYDQTLFGGFGNAFSQGDGWWRTSTQIASYSSNGNQKVSFEFAVGIAVTYTNPSGQFIVRQYGIDPEMDADNFG